MKSAKQVACAACLFIVVPVWFAICLIGMFFESVLDLVEGLLRALSDEVFP